MSQLNNNFMKWFGSSKVVNTDGTPLVVYHGSNSDIKSFNSDFSAQGVFWFSSDRAKIERGESGASSSKYLIPAYIRIEKMAGWSEYDKYGLGELRDLGYDGIKLDDDYVVFSPNQIKSINNKGIWSKSRADIFESFVTSLYTDENEAVLEAVMGGYRCLHQISP